MFIKYQAVRNTVVGIALVIGGGIAAMYLFGGKDAPAPTPENPPIVLEDRPPVRETAREARNRGQNPDPASVSSSTSAIRPRTETPPSSATTVTTSVAATPRTTEQERYLVAMKIATSKAAANGKGKDVLGPQSPWKLNLYDDDKDGQWDRGKLDYDRDEEDDEKWNFKQGRWEKDGGATIWVEDRWVPSSDTLTSAPSTRAQTAPSATAKAKENSDGELVRYRAAMKAAASRATADGKGKDVLGASSPWKLNLYDDNKDGQWDRAKLDYDRDDEDDEKWNFKNGRWEKDGGDTIWNGNQWVPNE